MIELELRASQWPIIEKSSIEKNRCLTVTQTTLNLLSLNQSYEK